MTTALSVTPHCYWLCVTRYLESFGDKVFEHCIDTRRNLAEAQLRLGEWQFLRGAKLY